MTHHEEMEILRKDALAKADALTVKKGQDYGKWYDYDEVTLAALNLVKAKRLLHLAIKIAANPQCLEANEPMEDSAVDAVNYASFLYGKVRERKERMAAE